MFKAEFVALASLKVPSGIVLGCQCTCRCRAGSAGSGRGSTSWSCRPAGAWSRRGAAGSRSPCGTVESSPGAWGGGGGKKIKKL